MEQFKIEIGRLDGIDLLSIVKNVSSKKKKVIKSKMISLLNFTPNEIKGNLYAEIRAKLQFSMQIKDDFDSSFLMGHFEHLGISKEEKVHLIWDFDSTINELTARDLVQYWDYLWYGPSDELLLLYFENDLLILVTDYKVVYWDKIG